MRQFLEESLRLLAFSIHTQFIMIRYSDTIENRKGVSGNERADYVFYRGPGV